MAKKAELEAAFARYDDLCRRTAQAEADHDFPQLVRDAVAALPLLRDALAYQRKYQPLDAPHLPTVNRLLRYAPPLFAADALNAVEDWVRGRNKAEKAGYPDLPARLADARATLAAAAGLWAALQHSAGPPAVAPGVAEAIVETWLAAGLVVRLNRTRLAVVTDLRRAAEAKCSGCGTGVQAAAVEFLAPLVCVHCRQRREFVILRRLF